MKLKAFLKEWTDKKEGDYYKLSKPAFCNSSRAQGLIILPKFPVCKLRLDRDTLKLVGLFFYFFRF